MIISTPVRLLQRRAPDGAQRGVFTGLASTWEVDRDVARFERGAWAASCREIAAGTTRVPLLDCHQLTAQVGVVRSAAETDAGLEITGELVLGSVASDRIYALMLRDALSLSVGAGARLSDIVKDTKGITVIKAADLWEVSVVSTASNRQSVIHSVKTPTTAADLADCSVEELEALLHAGQLPELPRRLAKSLARMSYAQLTKQEPDESAELAVIAAALDTLKSVYHR